ncbi:MULTISPECIES: hypothetical protein [Kamptonema]|uniref:hypothetical protein n=1 Tax=Kamptonema TaxID=1501433 RepID=UPI0001DACFB9|nr:MULTISPECIES: hypothetical protein [Kamptonema]CBN59312.1 conserved hypothetical protein [Kamptonema sp. PCC 6506]
MSEDQPQQPQPEQPQPEVKPIATSQNAAKTPQDSAKLDRSLLEKLTSAWLTVVQLVRSLLPASINQKLSDTVLSSAIAATLIVAIGTTLTLLPGKSPEIIVIPSSESPQIVVIPSPESSEIVVIPSSESTEIVVLSSPETTATNLPDLVAPEETKPVEIAPPSPPKLTPEQNLIATIQNQVDELTNQFNNSLIESIQVNLFSNILAVKIGDDWYNLPESEQNQLANQMFQQAQKLEFRKLEIANSQGKLIARSPVIGSEMIILERKKAENIGNG